MSILGAAVIAFALSFAGCLMITVSRRLRTLGNVAPVDDRWHRQATPGLGGIPIYLSFCLATCVLDGVTMLSIAMLVAAWPLLVTGTYDDLKPLQPGLKLAAQFLSASVYLLFVISPFGIPHFLGEGNSVYLMIGFLFCLIWMLAIINAINLLDNMDGLAAGIALIACVTLTVLIYRSNQHLQIGLLLVILAASIGGFLVLNYKPAKLFMGDAGALWIGFIIAASSLIVMRMGFVTPTAQTSLLHPANWLLVLMVCAVPISDTLMVMITRTLRGQAISVGGRDHLSHRLVAVGFSERAGVAILWVLAIVASLLALLMQTFAAAVWIFPVAAYIVLLIASIVWLVLASSLPESTTGSTVLSNAIIQHRNHVSVMPHSKPNTV